MTTDRRIPKKGDVTVRHLGRDVVVTLRGPKAADKRRGLLEMLDAGAITLPDDPGDDAA